MKTVKIGDKERPVKFNTNALIELLDDHGIDILNGGFNGNVKSIRAICFIGLKFGALAEKKEVDFTIEDVGNWLSVDDDTMTPDGAMGQIVGALKKQSDNGTKSEAVGELVGGH